MRPLMIPAAVMALAGCATEPEQPQMTLEQQIQSMSYMELCERVFYGRRESAQLASEEAQRRGIDCRNHQQEAAAINAQKEANRAAAIQYLLNRQAPASPTFQPAPAYQMQPRQTTNCRSYWMGGQLHTTCN